MSDRAETFDDDRGKLVEVVNGDCRECLQSIVKEVKNPVIVTDPPFNIGYVYNNYADKMPDDECWDFIAWVRRQTESAVIIHRPESLHRLSMTLGEVPDRIVSWIYRSNTMRQHKDVAYYGVKPDFSKVKQPYYSLKDKRCAERMKVTGGGRSYDWWMVAQVKGNSKEKVKHPCQMPLQLMEKVVGVLPDNITVIDPFMGSGTTVLACVRQEISVVGIEISSEYVQIARERIKAQMEARAHRQEALFDLMDGEV